MSRVSFILVFSLGLVVGCTLNDPKQRQNTSHLTTPPRGDKPLPTEGEPRNPPPARTAPTEPDGLPRAIETSGTTPAGSSTAATAPVVENKTTDPKKENAIPMEMSFESLTSEFMNVVGQTFQYASASPTVEGAAKICLLSFHYDTNPGTINKYLGHYKVKVDDNSWDDFSIGILAQSASKTRVTETKTANEVYHNLDLEDIKPSGEKQRMTIQYLFANGKREIRAVRFERGLVTNEHRSLVCVVKTANRLSGN